MQRILELSYDKIVIGSDLDALSFSYSNNCHLIYIKLQKPIAFDILPGWENRIELWNKFAFNLSFGGYMPFVNKIDSIRLEDDYIKAITVDNLLLKIKYNKLYISDPYKVEGLPANHEHTNDKVIIQDYFDVTSGMHHEHTLLTSNDELVSKLYFYNSTRQHNWPDSKDCVAVSLIDSSNLLNEDYSQGVVRIKSLNMMKEAGIKGKKNGNIVKHRPINIAYNRREIIPVGKTIFYNLQSNIEMLKWDWQKHEQDAIRTFK